MNQTELILHDTPTTINEIEVATTETTSDDLIKINDKMTATTTTTTTKQQSTIDNNSKSNEPISEKKRKLTLALNDISSSLNGSGSSSSSTSTPTTNTNRINTNNNNNNNITNKRIKAVFESNNLSTISLSQQQQQNLQLRIQRQKSNSDGRNFLSQLDITNNLPTPQLNKLMNELITDGAIRTPGSALALLTPNSSQLNNTFFNSQTSITGFTPIDEPNIMSFLSNVNFDGITNTPTPNTNKMFRMPSISEQSNQKINELYNNNTNKGKLIY
jgi:hypothetical protein